MFGRKKNKNQTREYIDGVPQKVPDLDLPNPYGEGPQHPANPATHSSPPIVDANCVICFDYGFYADNVGVWHHCPRCNAFKFDLAKQDKPEPEEKLKPLHKWKECVHCNAKNQVQIRKKEFKCESCGEVSI